MNKPDRCDNSREPLEIELLIPAHTRRVSINDQIHFQRCISTDDRELDELIDDLTIVDPAERHAPSCRSDKDLGEFLNLLDSLETGNDRKETTR